MTEYWLGSDENAAEVVLCNIRVKKDVDDQFQLQTTETNNNIVEHPPLDNNTVSNALVTGDGGEGYDTETGQQTMDADDYNFMFDTELLDFIDQQQPLMLPQDSIPPLGGQDLRSTKDQMEEYAKELENILDKDEEDDDDDMVKQQQQYPHIPLPMESQDLRSTVDQHMDEYAKELENILDKDEDDEYDRVTQQQQHPHIPLPLQVQDSGNPLVITEDECVGRQDILNLDQHMEDYAEELENLLDKDEEEEDVDSASQQQHPHIPLPPQVQDSGNPLVIMEDECVDQDIMFNLESVTQQQEQEKIVDTLGEMDCARYEMQGYLYFQDSYLAGIQEMSPWDNMLTNTNPFGLVFNTHGYEMQEPPVTNGVNKKSLGCVANCAMQEQRRKRRKQC
ncbi:PREDICTED: uncharacterized protein LOC104743115 [Camelina sativa]|uniref:Uncharacterized protein LOC104743115 n=1 Tax=Camelina sativa TaxID=90675 RepID=A0ABM0VXH6_CAMSA|nr:PREDICTED: uncharacterized protein LOC104743115 [Camelina sativa]